MKFLESDLFSPLDRTFAKWMAVQTRNDKELIALLAALVSRQLSQGNTCLDLDETIRDPELSTILPSDFISKLVHNRQWNSTSQQPIVIDDNKAYLHRYWRYEQALAENILSLSRSPSANLVDEATLERALDLNFTADNSLQRKAARTALTKSFCIITGGPGTGKTWTLARILNMLRSIDTTGKYRVALAAPTGKAAHRMEEALRNAFPGNALEAWTLHRLLKPVPNTPYFHYNRENPLPFDMVVVDEASMADLALLSKLTDALPKSGRLVLIGDKDQLASVEPGSVLGDICAACSGSSKLKGCLVELTQQHRYRSQGTIDALATAIKAGNSDAALALLDANGALKEVRGLSPLQQRLSAEIQPRLEKISRMTSPSEILDALDCFRILCAAHQGHFGKNSINERLSATARRLAHHATAGGYCHGMPVMALENDYTLNLFNGDTGVIANIEKEGLFACFKGKENELRRWMLGRLPMHEISYATTIHKAQGSEFEKTILILPEKPIPLLTRELIYTAVTRAKTSIEIWGRREVFSYAVSRFEKRFSGITGKLL